MSAIVTYWLMKRMRKDYGDNDPTPWIIIAAFIFAAVLLIIECHHKK